MASLTFIRFPNLIHQ